MLRREYGIPGPYEHLRKRGYLTAEELADRIGVCQMTVKKWGKTGLLKTKHYNDKGMVLYEDPGETVPVKWAWQRDLTSQSNRQLVIESVEGVQYEA